MRPVSPKISRTAGFTLIELSIVLVIIGFIVGGVLVGQDLIKASQLRAQVTAFEKWNQAVNTFNGKYGCLPGDCSNAATLLSTPDFVQMGPANGNGDGLLIDSMNMVLNTTGFPETVLTEPSYFWYHLWVAGLSDCCNNYDLYDLGYTIGYAFPQDKVSGNGITVGAMQGRNGYYWGILTGCPGTGCTCGGGNPDSLCNLTSNSKGVLTPIQAQRFDAKIDDGLPNTGNVYVANMSGGDNHVHPGVYSGDGDHNCEDSTVTTYNITYGQPICNLWINMQGM